MNVTVVDEQKHSLDWIYFDIFVRKRFQGQIQPFLRNRKYKLTLNESQKIMKNIKTDKNILDGDRYVEMKRKSTTEKEPEEVS